MKVLHLSTWRERCGIAGYTRDLINALDALGTHNDVYPVVRRGRRYPLVQEVRVQCDRFHDRARDYDLVHIQHEFSFFHDYSRRLWGSIDNFGYLLARLNRLGKPVVVTLHTEPDFVPSLARVACRRLGAAGRLRSYFTGRRWRRRVGTFFSDRNRRFLAIVHTAKARATLVATGFGIDRIHKLPIGVTRRDLPSLPERREAVRQRLGYPPGAVLLTQFGFIGAYKGYDVTLSAMLRLPKHYHLAIVGGPHPQAGNDTSTDQILKFVAEHPGLAERVRITGYASPETVDLYHSATDVCLAPYRDVNSASAAIARALGSGRPVIASNIPSFVEINDEADCLLLVTEGAQHELAWQIEQLIAQPQSQEELVRRAATYGERNSWDAVARATLGLYERLCEASRRRKRLFKWPGRREKGWPSAARAGTQPFVGGSTSAGKPPLQDAGVSDKRLAS